AAVGGLERGAVVLLAHADGVAVQAVGRAEAAHAFVDPPLHVSLDRDVAGDRDRLAAGLLDPRDGPLRRLRVDIGHDDPRALLGEERGRLAPHAHAGAGDERDLAVEPPAHRLAPAARSSARLAANASTTSCMTAGVSVPMLDTRNAYCRMSPCPA